MTRGYEGADVQGDAAASLTGGLDLTLEPSDVMDERHVGAELRRSLPERTAGALVGVVCALLLAGGVVVVVLEVAFRYLIDDPLIWTGEVSVAILIALTFVGGALTLYRGEHLGVMALRNRLTGAWRSRVDGGSTWVVLAVSLGLSWAAVPALNGVRGQTTPSGLLPASIDYYPVLVGAIAMCVFAAFHLTRIPRRALLESGVVVAVLVSVVVAWGVIAPPSSGTAVVVMLVVAAICLAGSVPISYALGAGGLAYLGVTHTQIFAQFAQQMEFGVANFVLLSVPFFVLAGLVMSVNGMSDRLVAFLQLLLGRVHGGLQLIMIAAMAIFSGISGSKSADVAAVGSIMMPAMRNTKAEEDDAVALLAASAVMGETIPPCINMIILGYVANVSIGGLFLAGVLPAAVIAVALAVIAVLTARRMHRSSLVGHGGQAVSPPRASRRQWLATGSGALSAIVMIVIIFGGIEGGIATPTEVSAVAVVYALVVGGLAFRQLTWRSFGQFWTGSASLAGMILFIVAAASVLSNLLTVNLIPQRMAAALVDVAHGYGSWAFILITIAMLIIMGSVLEGAPALIIFGPLLIPAATELGINPLQTGILLIIAMGIGLFAPPLGVGLYTASAVSGVPMERVAKPVLKYLGVILVMLLLIAFVPAITLTIPNL